MPKFVISPHFRLHEWVAEEKGYFRAEGLEYEFREVFDTHATPNKVGAYTSFEKGRDTNVSCACHWTVNVAASQGLGKNGIPTLIPSRRAACSCRRSRRSGSRAT